jgi:hypothetical protein
MGSAFGFPDAQSLTSSSLNKATSFELNECTARGNDGFEAESICPDRQSRVGNFRTRADLDISRTEVCFASPFQAWGRQIARTL